MTPISWSGVKDEEGQWDGLGAQTALAQAGSPVQSQNLSGALHALWEERRDVGTFPSHRSLFSEGP